MDIKKIKQKTLYCRIYDNGDISTISFDNLNSFKHGENVAVYELKEMKTVSINLQ